MKKTVVILMTLMLLVLCGCKSTFDKTQDVVEEFLLCVHEDRFDDAEKLMYPDLEVKADEISSFFSLKEKMSGADFSKKFQIIEYELEEWEDKDPIVEGKTIEGNYIKATGWLESDYADFTFKIMMVEKDDVIKIYRMEFTEKN